MKRCFFYGLVLLSALKLFAGCSKKSADTLLSPPLCDTSAVVYARDIVPIMQAWCYSCHKGENVAFSNGVNLEGYDNLKGWMESGFVIGNVSHASGFIPMPYGKPKIPECEINTLIAWMNQHYPQ